MDAFEWNALGNALVRLGDALDLALGDSLMNAWGDALVNCLRNALCAYWECLVDTSGILLWAQLKN